MKDPFLIGAAAPSSRFVSRELTKTLKNHAPGVHILELGAGQGAVTAFIAPLLLDGDVLDVVEINPALCHVLQERFKNHPHVKIHCTSVLDWKPSYTYDYIISTLPFSAFGLQEVQAIIKHLQMLSKPQTPFSYVEYRGAATLRRFFASRCQRPLLDAKKQFLSQLRERGNGSTRTVWLSIPPAYVHHFTLQGKVKRT